MHDILQKLLIQRQMKWHDSGFTLLGEEMSIISMDLLIDLQSQLNDIGEQKIAYSVFKEAARRTVKNFTQRMRMNEPELNIWLRAMAYISGWGQASLVHMDREKHHFMVKLTKSPVAERIRNKDGLQRKPVDHMFRGLIAGSFSTICKREMGCVETKCRAMGANECVFVVKPMEDFDFSKDNVKDQLESN